jgi:hypothetical protein
VRGRRKDRLNTALREVLDNRRRALALTRLRSAADEGGFDLDLFEDRRIYRRRVTGQPLQWYGPDPGK